MKEKINVATVWYNEAQLAPFFLKHYAYADNIIVFMDTGTDDATRQICSKYKNVRIEDMVYPAGYNCRLQVERVSEAVRTMDCDWVISVDADEFVVPVGLGNTRNALKHADGNLIYAQLWQVYRNVVDADLDSKQPAILQRRHGDPNTRTGMNRLYNKPIIVKPGTGIVWDVGFHAYRANSNIKVSTTSFMGAHWQMADVDIAIQRRIKGQRDRQSKENIERRWAVQHHAITAGEIRATCEKHLHDPQLF